MYIDDCVYGTFALTMSDLREPLNIGSDELVTINQLLDIVENIAGVKLTRRYNLDAPRGVRGRSSGNASVKQALGWAPTTKLRDGMEHTYRWICEQLMVPAGARRGYS
jgi:GDP-D-mannose 3', 5'-epimerase